MCQHVTGQSKKIHFGSSSQVHSRRATSRPSTFVYNTSSELSVQCLSQVFVVLSNLKVGFSCQLLPVLNSYQKTARTARRIRNISTLNAILFTHHCRRDIGSITANDCLHERSPHFLIFVSKAAGCCKQARIKVRPMVIEFTTLQSTLNGTQE